MHNQDDISERIASARRDAELLKDRIRQRRDALADTTCKLLET
jgi:guanine nucleotide-binding protein G(I)/G(S)/G(T) subunit beta-1